MPSFILAGYNFKVTDEQEVRNEITATSRKIFDALPSSSESNWASEALHRLNKITIAKQKQELDWKLPEILDEIVTYAE